MAAETPLRVAAAVIRRADGAVLLSLRRPGQHQGGRWEFPGGKLRPGESPLAALQRELDEELDIRIEPTAVRPLIEVHHAYPELSVHLAVSEVFGFRGEPRGREGQRIGWFSPAEIRTLDFPAANQPILAATLLPRVCLVTPEMRPDGEAEFLTALRHALTQGIRLVQLRLNKTRTDLASCRVPALIAEVLAACQAGGAQLVLNLDWSARDVEAVRARAAMVEQLGADGFHLPSRVLRELPAARLVRPSGMLISAACHSHSELVHAEALGVDFAFLGNVLETASHPGRVGLGWSAAEQLVRGSRLPLFALGGQDAATVPLALAAGFHGIAAIRGLWGEKVIIPDARLRP